MKQSEHRVYVRKTAHCAETRTFQAFEPTEYGKGDQPEECVICFDERTYVEKIPFECQVRVLTPEMALNEMNVLDHDQTWSRKP